MSEVKKPAKFGPSIVGDYPAEMRRQLWPLCCGAAILSGFKAVQTLTDAELVEQINHTVDEAVPDMQVFGHESMRPKLTFLTLNSGQMQSPKIMKAIAAAGFVKFGEGSPRGSAQGFFVKDTSGTFKLSKIA